MSPPSSMGADPEHAWDFNWYYNGVIKNWTQAVAGEVPVDQTSA